MNTFVDAVINQDARTENGMKARASSASACVDLFFKIGAMRGQDPIPAFTAAYVEDPEIATRIALWARDARSGAGERAIFRAILKHAIAKHYDNVFRLLTKAVELGRWDDVLLVFELDDFDPFVSRTQDVVVSMINDALAARNGLCAKWMPRQGALAAKLRTASGMSPKQWRKTLVSLTNVVETKMCAKDWDNINFSHVPSIAVSRYKKAFNRHTTKYGEWVEKLVKGDKTVKVNAGAIYPHEVLKGVENYQYLRLNAIELNAAKAQWDALPNYIGNASILPLVDVSGSMIAQIPGSKTTALDVAVSLGLYCADKNKGKFKDTFLTFSGTPELLHLKGDILQKVQQMVRSNWEMNTDLHAAFEKILSVAVKGNVPLEEMPQTLLIMSDMQFDNCVYHDDSAIQMIRRKYENHGYQMPNVVFWNFMARSNVPVKFDAKGTALVSGFSPSILKSVLSGDMEDMTPHGVMMRTLLNERYA